MATTPLYKSLKSNGTSFYAFPGAAEDISAAYQNENYKMYFSKYILLNFPKQNLSVGTNSNPIVFDFQNSFQQSNSATPATSYSDEMIESLRNYVANYEVTMKDSLINNTEYFYDNTQIRTPSEKIFWKWCKKLNVIDFETAIPDDEYVKESPDFVSNSVNDPTYFPEILWKEREVFAWDITDFSQSTLTGFIGNLQVQFSGTTNFRVGDKIVFNNVSNSTVLAAVPGINGMQANVVVNIAPGATQGQSIVLDITPSTFSPQIETTGTTTIVYNRLVQTLGEVHGINNVQQANRSYTEVYLQIPAEAGNTPDVLFRLNSDVNYGPNLIFPILPSQIQPEIIGAELFTSPIVNTPQNYPGSYYGQFDTSDFTYQTSSGDSLRRSGDYYGISGDINNPISNGSTVDGITIDWNNLHYSKMNILGREISIFDEFNVLEVNNQPPSSYEFNAVLWYYTVEDPNGNVTNNLYGITFLDNPENNKTTSEIGIRFPTYTKLVSNGLQDGTSYGFSLNLSFNIIDENPVDAYNPSSINSLFSMNLFNDAMTRLASLNDSFLTILASQNKINSDLDNLKGLIYTQQDFDLINAKLTYYESLLNLYQSNQLVSSDTIDVVVSNVTSPPLIQLNSKDPSYYRVDYVNTTHLYNSNGIIPYNSSVPSNKNWLIYITNNDQTNVSLPNNDKLTVVISQDLSYRQSVDIVIDCGPVATENKQLEIYLNYSSQVAQSNQATSNQVTNTVLSPPTETLIVGPIDIPVYYNQISHAQNSAKTWNEFKFNIDYNQNLVLNTGGILEVPIDSNYNIINNSIKSGDTLVLNDFTVGTVSTNDFSGQYTIDSVGATNSYIYLDISNNADLVAYGNSLSLPLVIHSATNSTLTNLPYFSLNKGVKYKITRIDPTNTSTIQNRYLIEKQLSV